MNLYLAAALACAVIGIAWLVWEVRHAPDIADYLGVSEIEAANLFDGILHGDLDSNVGRNPMTTLRKERTGGATNNRVQSDTAPRTPSHAPLTPGRPAKPSAGKPSRRRSVGATNP